MHVGINVEVNLEKHQLLVSLSVTAIMHVGINVEVNLEKHQLLVSLSLTAVIHASWCCQLCLIRGGGGGY